MVAKLESTNAALASAKSEMDLASSQADNPQKVVQPIAAEAEKVQALAGQAVAAFLDAERELQRWRSEIQFRDQLIAFQQQLQSAQSQAGP